MKNISERQLQAAVERAGFESEVFKRIWAAVLFESDEKAGFEAAHIAYYFGALLIIGAMGWFITNAWDSFSGATLTLIALGYAAVFGFAGITMWRKPATHIPGGLLAAVAVCMTPLAVYGIERQLGWWPAFDPGSYTKFHPLINGSWVGMEAMTILVAALFLRFVRFPFITAPAAYALWYMSMDATSLLFNRAWNFHDECHISAAFGLGMMLIGFFADGEADQDFAFWFYLFGLLAFTGGLSLLGNGSQLGKAVYCLVHLVLIMLSIVLQRRAFLVFGAIGVFIYLANEAFGFFKNSYSFTFGLTILGILFIAAGVFYKRHEANLACRLARFVPKRVSHRHSLSF
jgi:hypothetical protein